MSVVQPDVALRLSAWLNHWPPPYTLLILHPGPETQPWLSATPSHINPSLGKEASFPGPGTVNAPVSSACGQQKGRGCRPPSLPTGLQMGVCAPVRDRPGWLSPGSTLLRSAGHCDLPSTHLQEPARWRQREKRHWGRSGRGTRAGRPQSSGPGQLTQCKSTPTPRDWLGHARLVRANPGLLPVGPLAVEVTRQTGH